MFRALFPLRIREKRTLPVVFSLRRMVGVLDVNTTCISIAHLNASSRDISPVFLSIVPMRSPLSLWSASLLSLMNTHPCSCCWLNPRGKSERTFFPVSTPVRSDRIPPLSLSKITLLLSRPSEMAVSMVLVVSLGRSTLVIVISGSFHDILILLDATFPWLSVAEIVSTSLLELYLRELMVVLGPAAVWVFPFGKMTVLFFTPLSSDHSIASE